jgi:putative transposase
MTNPLGMAISNRNPSTGGIIHSDHGIRSVRLVGMHPTSQGPEPLPPMGSNGSCP